MSLDVESELRTLSAQQLRQEKQSITSQLLHVQQQISDLAYGNYRTYADAGSTTEHCRRMFGEANELVNSIDAEIEGLRCSLNEFGERSVEIGKELGYLRSAESKGSPLWDILSLPSRMDVCIRAGYYEVAYSLTNYGIQLQQHGLTKNPAIKAVADKLMEARHYLLDELFNRFAGPIDLASSIQVVNNIRKIPYLSATQLRVSILQYRDIYLEKQILDIRSQPDFILRMVEVYRDCMYDTMVLYLAVFPEGEILKRDPSSDPRWDVWQHAGPSAVLSEWAIRNFEEMFEHIRNVDNKSSVDVGALSSKLMSFALSFGRMGMDFRPLIANVIHEFIVSKFSSSTMAAASKLAESESINIEGDLPEVSVTTHQSTSGVQPSPPAALVLWDDLCVYGNALLEAINELRNGLSPNQINAVLDALSDSLKSVFSWLDQFADVPDQQNQFSKAIQLLSRYFVPYLNRCLLVLFPYEKCCRPFYHTAFSLEQYEKRCCLSVADLYAHCAHSAAFDEIVKPLEVEEKARISEIPSLDSQNKLSDNDTVVSPVDFAEKPSEKANELHLDTNTNLEEDEVDFTVRERAATENESLSDVPLNE